VLLSFFPGLSVLHQPERCPLLRVLGLMRVRNGGLELPKALDSLANWCDDIYVLNDRSTDETAQVLATHPGVSNIVHARADLPADPWLIPESVGLELLYRMADFCRPDWIIIMDHDQVFVADIAIRAALAAVPDDVACLKIALTSSWNDPRFPRMVPLMGSARSTRHALWRYFPGMRAGRQPLHNKHCPTNLAQHGRLELLAGVRLEHSGWDTLAKRIAKVKLYQRLDPTGEFNHGVAYDRALLFGYALDEVEELQTEYLRRVANDGDPIPIRQ